MGAQSARNGRATGAQPAETDLKRFTLAEAASRLGVSVRTVQRRVASGQLASEPGPNGSKRILMKWDDNRVSEAQRLELIGVLLGLAQGLLPRERNP